MIYKVQISGVDTAKLPVLKEDELRNLPLLIKNGNEESMQLMITSNLRLVLSVLQKFNNRGENIDDSWLERTALLRMRRYL